jgi:pyruvate formate lyase activating enzyme
MASVVVDRVGDRAVLPAQGSRVTASVHGWDLVAGEYGPGTRYVLLCAGCPRRCLSCPAPRSWLEQSGRPVGVDQVLAQVARYRPLSDLTGGGVTLSGGEPLVHAPFVGAFVRQARGSGLHLAVTTSGIGGDRVDDATLAGLDLVLLDLKAFDPAAFRRLTGHRGGPALRFAERVAEVGTPLWVKMVVVPGITDGPGQVAGLAAFLGGLATVEHVDVVPFDRAGQTGWAEVGLDYPLAARPGPTHDALEAVRVTLRGAGLTVA